MITQTSIPEVKEDAVGYALNERKQKLSQFLDLGPPDLITMVKYSASSANTTNPNSATASKSGDVETVDPNNMLNELHSHDKLKGELGTFFYSLGGDTSDPTSITIFLKQIADIIVEQPQVWFGKKKNFQVARISLSTWNTFRKCDMNIIVHIPGTVQLFILQDNGEQLDVKPDSNDSKLIWAETFISGVVRSMMLMKDNYEDGELQNLVETLIVNPMASGEIDSTTDTFINLFPMVYEHGDLLGAPSNVINVSRTNNYLVETLIELVSMTHSVEKARAMLEELIKTYPEAIIILIRILLANDYEIDGMELLHDQVMEIEKYNDVNNINSAMGPIFPQDYRSELLCVQVNFLIDIKRDFKLAQNLAQTAVNCAPSEFQPWYLLSKSYIKLNDIENALLSLNACPMQSIKEKYLLKRVVPFQSDSSLHLPLPMDAVLEGVTSLNPQDIQQEHKNADPVLTNLAASGLKATFPYAYQLLTEIVQKTGWENLLKIRSKLFVMEDEYQNSTDEVYKAGGVNESNVAIKSDMGSIDTSSSYLRAKRLCERWLDNLFMLLYEDLKTYTLWQGEQVYFEAQNSTYNKLTFEWELYGLCAKRLGHLPEAAQAWQRGLSQRFASLSAKKLLEYYINERNRIRQLSNLTNSNMTSGQIMTRINELDQQIIDLIVKICCWNHRWYIEFSRLLIISTGIVIEDLGITKVSNEIAAKYPESVSKLVQTNILDFFSKYTNDHYDN
ncbi:protein Bch1p [Monosporozyma servazzii]